jgi:uncharacterized protein YndB with AHSA1/START domain
MTDKKTIELTKKFDAPVAVLFDAIKDGQLLKSTGVTPETFKHDFRVGGEFSLEWTSKTAGACTGRYLHITPNEQVKFTWSSTGCKSATKGETMVTIRLKDCGKTSEMLLIHEGLDAGFCYEDHLAGWTSSVNDFNAEIERSINVASSN